MGWGSGGDPGSVFQHMREVAQRRQQLEVEHEQARLSLQEKQEEVQRLQQVGQGFQGQRKGSGLLDPSSSNSKCVKERKLSWNRVECCGFYLQNIFQIHPLVSACIADTLVWARSIQRAFTEYHCLPGAARH